MPSFRDLTRALGSLVDRARSRFDRPDVAYTPRQWWEAYGETYEGLRGLAVQVLDDFGLRYPMDLVVPGLPESRSFRNVAELALPAAGAGGPGAAEVLWRAPVQRHLVLRRIEFTPLTVDAVDVTTFHNFVDKNLSDFEEIQPDAELVNTTSSIHYDRAVLWDGQTLRIRLENSDPAVQRWRMEAAGWIR